MIQERFKMIFTETFIGPVFLVGMILLMFFSIR